MATQYVPVSVYLDACVIIDLVEALGESWRPPADVEEDNTERQRLAAARIFFYGYRDRPPHWMLSTSESVMDELREPTRSFMKVHIGEVDSGDCTSSQIECETKRLEAHRIDEADAGHLANAPLRPRFSVFVTNDKKFCRKAIQATQRLDIRIMTAIQAEEELAIARGEKPPISPSGSNPLVDESWWVPRS